MLWVALLLVPPIAVLVAIALGGRAHAAIFPHYATLVCRLGGTAGYLAHRLGVLPAASPSGRRARS